MEIQTDNPKEGYPFPCFSYDEKKSVVANTAYIMTSITLDVRYILAILNSSIGGFLAKLYVTQLQQRQFRMLAQYVTNFPIPKCSNKEMDALIGLVKSYLECPSVDIEEAINEKAFELYGLNDEEKEFIRNKED